jgi:glycosyltransferase involved in cell wall biosynthesis
MVAGAVSGTPFVTTYHSSHFLKRTESPFWRSIFRRFLEAADHNLAASGEIARVAASLSPGVEVEALTNGVETDFFRPVEPTIRGGDSRILIVPRRLFPKNGVEYFIRALPLILERFDVTALIVGDGPERGRLHSLTSQLGVADRVRFLGARPHQEMPGLLSSAELAVFPSLMEATSVAALESMACGVPVAASRVGGLPEIVDSEVGGLFEAGNPAALASTVVQLLERGELRSLGAEARRRVVERWSNARLTDRHLEIYEQLVAQRRAA